MNVAITAATGFVFWLLATRSVSDVTVGRSAALASSATFVAFITNMGLPLAVGRYAAGRDRDDSARFALAVVAAAAVGAAGGVGFLVIAPGAVRDSIDDAGWSLVFVVIAAFGPLIRLADVRLLALQRFAVVVLRPVIGAGLKIGGAAMCVAFLPEGQMALGLFAALFAPDAIVGLALAGWLGWSGAVTIARRRVLPPWRAALRSAGLNYLSVVLVQGAMFVVPVIVLAMVDSSDNANFYVAWSFALVATVLTQSVMWGLHIEADLDEPVLRQQTTRAIRVAAMLGAAITVASLLLVPIIPAVYGADFAAAGRIAPIAVGACIPYSTNVLILTEARVVESVGRIVRVSTTYAALVVLPVLVVTPVYDIEGAAVAVLCGAAVAAAINGMIRRGLESGDE